jgi:hypothetical protein
MHTLLHPHTITRTRNHTYTCTLLHTCADLRSCGKRGTRSNAREVAAFGGYTMRLRLENVLELANVVLAYFRISECSRAHVGTEAVERE